VRPRNWFLISRVEVDAPDAAGVIVAFGDSITDGTASRDTNRRWPDLLTGRMLSSSLSMRHGVVNARTAAIACSAMRVAPGINALARLTPTCSARPA
jgi:lysophospholipase L1-like esterase